MELFYQPEGPRATSLSESESRHCLRVIRKKKGDAIQLVDGKGNFYRAMISGTQDLVCSYEIIDHHPQPQTNYYIHLAIAPTKNKDRMEWLVEKAVEIGVDEFSFIHCQRSERKRLDLTRMEKKAIMAMKQSLSAFLPQINPIISYPDFLNQLPKEYDRFIAHLPGDSQPLRNVIENNKRYCLLIGPEGGFTKDELSVAVDFGFQPVTLGKNRLRTETAALIGCHTFHLENNTYSENP